jgi:ubiquinone/menaquinone biosynthesis C-methylase UbiE
MPPGEGAYRGEPVSHQDGLTGQVTDAYTALGRSWDTAGAAWNQPVAARLVALAGLAPGMHVLDAGCGAGAATIPAARAVSPGGQVTGIDVAEPMLERTRDAAGAAGLDNVTVQNADAADPPFAPASCDAILACLVAYLLPDPAAAISRWHCLLRPAGILALSWVLTDDPAWAAVFAAVDEFLPGGQQGWAAFSRRAPWSSVPAVEAMLAAYSRVTTTAEPVTTRYDSPDHWWASSWTQAPALIWRHIPPGRRGQARDGAFKILKDLRGADGTLARTRTVCYTTARPTPASG